MISLDNIAIDLNSGFRLYVVNRRGVERKHTPTSNDNPELLRIHIRADEIDEKYDEAVKNAIKKSREIGKELNDYRAYQTALKSRLSNIIHPGYLKIIYTT